MFICSVQMIHNVSNVLDFNEIRSDLTLSIIDVALLASGMYLRL